MNSKPSNNETNFALLSHLLGVVLSLIGPLIIWLVKKEEGGFVEDQSREALNFQISLMIYAIVTWLLCFVVVGFVLLPIIGFCGIIFPIIATVKSSNGVLYRYPFIFRLVKGDSTVHLSE